MHYSPYYVQKVCYYQPKFIHVTGIYDSHIDSINEHWFIYIYIYIYIYILLSILGETAKELSGMVKSIKKASIPVQLSPGTKCLDIVGTGGDGADTINISTAASILCAAAGTLIEWIFMRYDNFDIL